MASLYKHMKKISAYLNPPYSMDYMRSLPEPETENGQDISAIPVTAAVRRNDGKKTKSDRHGKVRILTATVRKTIVNERAKRLGLKEYTIFQ